MGHVTLRFWASARAAAGVEQVQIPVPGPVPLADLVAAAVAARPGELARVLPTCSVLVDDRPAGRADHVSAVVEPGQVVEFLPPFAGG